MMRYVILTAGGAMATEYSFRDWKTGKNEGKEERKTQKSRGLL